MKTETTTKTTKIEIWDKNIVYKIRPMDGARFSMLERICERGPEGHFKVVNWNLKCLIYYSTACLYTVDEQLAWKWLAPEAMRERMLRPLSDVWSFGIFVIELLQYGAEPYPGLYSSSVHLTGNFSDCLKWPE